MVENNTSKFGEQTIGIHGQELPKYSETEQSKEWWQYFPHTKQPMYQSQIKLKQSHKYWAPDDQMLLADTGNEQGP